MELLREEDVRVLVAQVSANPDFRMVAAQVRCHFFCLLFFCLLISSFVCSSFFGRRAVARACARARRCRGAHSARRDARGETRELRGGG